MIYIIEGPDGACKSTLANQLSQQTGIPVIHRDKPKTEEEKKQMYQMYMDTILANKDAIFDRSWYSEMVYGKIFRDESVISTEQMYEYEKALAEHGAMIIHCTDAIEILWKRCTDRGEDYVPNIEMLSMVKDEFTYLFGCMKHLIPIVKYIGSHIKYESTT